MTVDQPAKAANLTNEDRADLLADAYCGSHYDELDSIDRRKWQHYRAGVLKGFNGCAADAAPAGEVA